MRTIELIKRLAEVVAEHGDLEVVVPASGGHGHVARITEAAPIKVKAHGEGSDPEYLFRSDRLRVDGKSFFYADYQTKIEARPDQTVFLISEWKG